MNPVSPWTLRALQLFAAAAISLVLAVRLGLQNPFWAAIPVWVVAQPHRQDLLLRAVMRIAGTALGAAIGWAGLIWLPDEASRMALLIGSAGIGAALAYWIGTGYSYGVVLAAITVAVVIVPSMDHPVDATHLALDRIWCTLIGVISVTVITFAFTPRRTDPMPPRTRAGAVTVLRHGLIAAGCALAGALWVKTVGGPPGMAGAMSLSIFSVLACSTRMPTPMMRNLVPGTLIGVLAAVAYRALDLALPDPSGSVLLLALPFLAAGSVLRTHPRTAALGLDTNMVFLLAAEAGTQGHLLQTHVLAALSLLGSAIAFTAVFRRFGHMP
ncbi:FUSC family protein [Paracoccus shanxieyensis]|uniref:FUSC family protein n=1 Tax=Paracoccus shanxieyensis TaxID=2675752 RepID=A0A6L6J2G3_9RHOB|nr:FUSC family protein [Paracoccus shanxieyensis]MTH65572.1 hypothetical protein [Paracoccus shanxieyensis]MTH88632.1 hypothetical protein [Paracoccus shanxieyensis]